MKLSRSVSRGIFLTLTCVLSWPLLAQDRFDEEDASAFVGYRGYSTYRNQIRDEQNNVTEDRFSPQPILNQQFIQASEDHDLLDVSNTLKNSEEVSTRLEDFYRDRTKDEALEQYGYDLFYTAKKLNKDTHVSTPVGAVQDSYILQSGDEIDIIFSGERRHRQSSKITSDGRLFIDGLNPINAAGRSFAELKNAVTVSKQNMQYRGDIDICSTYTLSTMGGATD